VSLKKLISHTVIIGSLLIATPAGAVSKLGSPVKAENEISHAVSSKWYEPIWKFGPKAIQVFTCILYRESRSTWSRPDVKDGTDAQYGIFQINWSAGIWQKYAEPTLHIDIQGASAHQQALGVALIFKVDGYFPWKMDGCPEKYGYYY
jgi:hypothetical protein